MPWMEIIIVGLIFVYSIWMIVRHVRKSKQGACASCSMNKSCSSDCSTVTTEAFTEASNKEHNKR